MQTIKAANARYGGGEDTGAREADEHVESIRHALATSSEDVETVDEK